MMHMDKWRIIQKRQEADPWGEGTRMLLDVVREQQKRTVQVSGFTWDRAVEGSTVELPR